MGPPSTECMPTLSVCVPNFNHGAHLPEALDAIMEQSDVPVEIIVLDDASSDDSLSILDGYARRYPKLRIERNAANLGAAATISRLVEMAAGDYVSLLSADDRILPGMFDTSMRLLGEHPRAGLSCGLSRIMDAHGNDRG